MTHYPGFVSHDVAPLLPAKARCMPKTPNEMSTAATGRRRPHQKNQPDAPIVVEFPDLGWRLPNQEPG